MNTTVEQLGAAKALHKQAFGEQYIKVNGCAVEICGYMTGHVVRPVAFCDNHETAALIVEALKALFDRAIADAEQADVQDA